MYYIPFIIEVPSLVKILDIETLEERNTCTNFLKIFITFEYFDKTLEDELRVRAPQRKHFSESEIYNLIDCVLSAMIFLDFRNKEILQLCPRKILLSAPLTENSPLKSLKSNSKSSLN